MVRNLAYKSTGETVMRALDALGFEGRYETVYVPGNPVRKTNLGYGFVNFFALDDLRLCLGVRPCWSCERAHTLTH